MILMVNKDDNTKNIILAQSKDDVKAIKFFYENTWGFYSLWIKDDDEYKVPDADGIIGKILTRLKRKNLEVLGVGLLSIPKAPEIEEVTKTKEETPQVDIFKEI